MPYVVNERDEPSKISAELLQLLANVARLRSPVEGCLWFSRQNFQTIRRYLLEEVYEVLDALDSESPEKLLDELGDLMFQVLVQTQLASEQGWFSMVDVLDHLNQKILRRNPHVFGGRRADTIEEVQSLWMEMKVKEKIGRGAEITNPGVSAQIVVQNVDIVIRFPDQKEITVSSLIPDLRCAGYSPTYTRKGWIWCAYNNLLINEEIEMSEEQCFEFFQEMWSLISKKLACD